MLEPIVRHHYVNINNSTVHLVQYGHSESIIKSVEVDSIGPRLTTSDDKPHETKELVVFIPGNPGLLGMYHDFLVALYKTIARPSDKTNEPVLLAIGHNNFLGLDYQSDGQQQRHNDGEEIFIGANNIAANEPHGIELQCLNKLIILKQLLRIHLTNKQQQQGVGEEENSNSNEEEEDEDDYGRECGWKLTFVGHSMGCYIILKLLQDPALARAHAGSILVHPALENLALTKKGTVLANFFALKLDLLARLVAYGIEKLVPKSTILDITRLACSHEFTSQASSIVIESMAQIVQSNTLIALIEMAKSELDCIRDLDHDKMIKPRANKLRLIYAIDDHWVNARHRLELAQLYPELYIEEQQTMHAFIMDPNAVANYSIKFGMMIEGFFE